MKKQLLGVTALAAIMLFGCGAQETEVAGDMSSAAESAIVTENTSEASVETSIKNDEASVETSIKNDEASNQDSNYYDEGVDASDVNDDTANAGKMSSGPIGMYTHTITEQIQDMIVTYDYFYSFHPNGTGMAFIKDDFFPITWDDKTVTVDGETYAYTLTGDHLRVEENYGGAEYDKKPGDDYVLMGDFSELAGTFKPTESTDKAYGAGKPLPNLEIGMIGEISGGLALDQSFPYGKPQSVTKNEDGSYRVVVDYVDDLNQCYYDIYPKGVLAERDAAQADTFKDTVYVRVVLIDGGIMEAVYCQ
ncbi:MAG: hypothetical protein IKO84_12075 [Butyrivibrio sp.]|nr:hypothetical protein [Butyrivibrio sp.]